MLWLFGQGALGVEGGLGTGVSGAGADLGGSAVDGQGDATGLVGAGLVERALIKFRMIKTWATCCSSNWTKGVTAVL